MESIQFRSDIRLKDQSIIDESMVVTTLPGEIAQIINRPVSESMACTEHPILLLNTCVPKYTWALIIYVLLSDYYHPPVKREMAGLFNTVPLAEGNQYHNGSFTEQQSLLPLKRCSLNRTIMSQSMISC